MMWHCCHLYVRRWQGYYCRSLTDSVAPQHLPTTWIGRRMLVVAEAAANNMGWQQDADCCRAYCQNRRLSAGCWLLQRLLPTTWAGRRMLVVADQQRGLVAGCWLLQRLLPTWAGSRMLVVAGATATIVGCQQDAGCCRG